MNLLLALAGAVVIAISFGAGWIIISDALDKYLGRQPPILSYATDAAFLLAVICGIWSGLHSMYSAF